MARAWLFVVAACGRIDFGQGVPPTTDAAAIGADTRVADAMTMLTPPEFVQHIANENGATQTVTATFASPVAAGDLIIAGIDFAGSASAPPAIDTVADTFGDAFATLGPYDGDVDGNYMRLYIAYAIASLSGTDALTATLNSDADFIEFRIHEYANPGAVPFDTVIGSNGGTNGSDGAASTITTTGPEELIFAMVIDGTVGAGTGYTLRGSDFQDLTEDRVAATTSTYPVVASPTGDWVMIAASFRGR